MLTLEEFDSLECGDQIEAEQMFPTLIDEPVLLLTVNVSDGGNRKEFVVTYLGVTLGRWSCNKRQNGGLSWSL